MGSTANARPTRIGRPSPKLRVGGDPHLRRLVGNSTFPRWALEQHPPLSVTIGMGRTDGHVSVVSGVGLWGVPWRTTVHVLRVLLLAWIC